MGRSTFVLNRIAIDNVNQDISIDRNFGLTLGQVLKLANRLLPINQTDFRPITFECRDVIDVYQLPVSNYSDFTYLFVVTRE